MRFFEQSVETMPREALELLQIEKLSSLLEKIYGSNRFYTGKLDAVGIHPEVIQTFSDLASLPFSGAWRGSSIAFGHIRKLYGSPDCFGWCGFVSTAGV